MHTFIQVLDGVPYEHPLMIDNMRQLFPEHDLATAPDGFAHFVRVEKPIIDVYQKMDSSRGVDGSGCEYEATSNGFTDVWYILEMTAAEKIEKQNSAKDAWAINGFASWTFNETTCAYEPPTARPEDGEYSWDESTTSWVALP
jgi:hypothetical protein|tara:strand:- start:100 stop:528 length:429 start_codon:yes stop_codon:yes gene_type:complete